ncbi:tetratricopeptide repeat protein [Planctomycetes bacterium K23_9]|uniref:Lipoprotein NlpI n=1 Tax=Stieleria marina TaxID=1930275 RepID=A0A517NRE2_9BACT|nr:lipoprotein NlpI [Planctomycetes bacterium K23_9]
MKLSLLTGFAVLIFAFADADQSTCQAQSVSSLRATSLSALMKGDRETAIASADRMIKAYPDDTRATLLAADIYLRSAKPLWATRMFDRYLEDKPEVKAELWQRGIALYFIGEHAKAAEQFAEHRRVNPNDVENAAWHFLCVAKAESFAQAREKLLPAPDDPRVPMKQVLALLKTGNTDDVNRAVNATKVDTSDRQIAQFYGDFYLGLYADAKGNRKEAYRLMSRAVEDAPRNYMGDVARVYADYLGDKLVVDPKKEKLELPVPKKSDDDSEA